MLSVHNVKLKILKIQVPENVNAGRKELKVRGRGNNLLTTVVFAKLESVLPTVSSALIMQMQLQRTNHHCSLLLPNSQQLNEEKVSSILFVVAGSFFSEQSMELMMDDATYIIPMWFQRSPAGPHWLPESTSLQSLLR